MTTEPVAQSTTTNVPTSSAKNIFWLDVSLREVFSKFLYSSLDLVSDFTDFLYRLAPWVIDDPVYRVVEEQERTIGPVHAAHVDRLGRIPDHIVSDNLGFLTGDIYANFLHCLHCKRVYLSSRLGTGADRFVALRRMFVEKPLRHLAPASIFHTNEKNDPFLPHQHSQQQQHLHVPSGQQSLLLQHLSIWSFSMPMLYLGNYLS